MISNTVKNISFPKDSSRIFLNQLRFKNNSSRVKTLGGSNLDKGKQKKLAIQSAAALQNRIKWEREVNQEMKLPELPKSTKVYSFDDFKPNYMSLQDAVNVLTAAAQPEMYDCLDNPLFLNMKTKSNAKFINPMETQLVLPNILDFQPALKVIILCKDRNETDTLKNCGAKFVGDEELMENITTGVIHFSEYDIVLANLSLEKAVYKMRNIFKDKMPSSRTGRLTDDLAKAYELSKNLTLIRTEAINGIPEENYVNLTLGQAKWPVEQLETNLRSYLDHFESSKSGRTHGPLFKRAFLYLRPIDIHLRLDLEPFLCTTKE